MLFSSAGGYKVIYALENNVAKLINNMERGYMGEMLCFSVHFELFLYLFTSNCFCYCFSVPFELFLFYCLCLLRTVTVSLFFLLAQSFLAHYLVISWFRYIFNINMPPIGCS
jgi:hypothetical protein